jgi:hypothetical protein
VSHLSDWFRFWSGFGVLFGRCGPSCTSPHPSTKSFFQLTSPKSDSQLLRLLLPSFPPTPGV